MGMDVMGRKPTTPEGEYFRNSVWWWHPLADYCAHVAPDLWGKVEYPHSNDGSGLGARDSKALAKILEAEIAAGRTQMYADAYQHEMDAVPDETCRFCEGTGVRKDAVGAEMGQPAKVIQEAGHPRDGEVGWCNGCNGKGTVRPFDTHYPFSVENVREFVVFLKGSGGFNIY